MILFYLFVIIEQYLLLVSNCNKYYILVTDYSSIILEKSLLKINDEYYENNDDIHYSAK